jgi:hypothetical protein
MTRTLLDGGQPDRRRTFASAWWLRRQTRASTGGIPVSTLIQIASVAVAGSALVPAPASAHVKWFMPYDVTEAPASFGHVLTSHFLIVFMAFALLILAGFMFDRYVAGKWQFIAREGRRADLEERLMRAGMGGFFMALFAAGGVILTPELLTTAAWVPWLQFAIAVSMVFSRTCIAGAVGIVALYAYGASIYGVFHLADYPMFLGIAAYLALTSFTARRLRSLRMPILYVTLCASLMWGAIEKWAYPQWTLSLLDVRPYLTAGLPPDDFLMFAGFVEFALAFYILAGFSLVRPAIFGLLSIFIAAIFDFGKIDAIGHLPIMVPLLMMFLHGPTQLHRWFHKAGSSAVGDGHKVSVAFATAMCLFFTAYYGLQYEEYGRGPQPSKLASLQVPQTH